jgi:hypothetical protein
MILVVASSCGFGPFLQEPASQGRSLSNRCHCPFSTRKDALWFTYLADSKTVYVDFRSYQDLETQSARLWEYIGRHPVRRLIIDMRWNQGGNFTKGREYLIYKLIFMPP